MNVFITGAGGQVGRALSTSQWPEGFDIIPQSEQELDITSSNDINTAFEALVPDIIINCAAYTAVDQAEQDVVTANAVNCQAVENLSVACVKSGIPLIHLSTDYVFDGSKKGSYTETDKPVPMNVYGVSKLEGEERVRTCLSDHIIIRLSGVFSADGNNFVKTMLRLATEHKEIKVIDDQICCPTAASDISNAVISITKFINNKKDYDCWGTYHFCSTPPTSWFDFATTIFELAGKKGHPTPQLVRIKSSEYPSPTQRPPCSILDCNKIIQQFGIKQPRRQKSLEQILEFILGKKGA
jgi:dTDP-4-dehydrorhamnose reductase